MLNALINQVRLVLNQRIVAYFGLKRVVFPSFVTLLAPEWLA